MMAKNSMGQFLSALRRAEGLTQQDVADRLCVSNKAVSRWERDECAPDLSLIPIIADLFGVTCDELLRGQRNGPRENAEEDNEKSRAKSEKHFKALLGGRMRKYRNLTFLSVGIALLGLLAAVTANFVFFKGLLAFFLAAAFVIASELCQLCAASGARVFQDGEDDAHVEMIRDANMRIMKTAVAVSFGNITLLAFCLPPAVLGNQASAGLSAPYFLGYGLVYAFLALAFSYVFYLFWLRKRFLRTGWLRDTEKETARYRRNQKLLLKTAAVTLSVAALLGVGIFAWNTVDAPALLAEKEVFSTCEEFKAAVEEDCNRSLSGGEAYDGGIGTAYETPIDGVTLPERVSAEIKNSSGDVICSYFYNPERYYSIAFNETSEDKTPITVITRQAAIRAWEKKNSIESALYGLIFLDFLIATGIYIGKSMKKS